MDDADLMVEALVICNFVYLSRAFSNNTFNYRFSVPPGIHGLDLLHTFYPTTITIHGEQLTLRVPMLHAQGLQSHFVSFVKHGDPNVERRHGTVEWPLFADNNTIVNVNPLGFSVVTDDEISEERCEFWQRAPYIRHQRHPSNHFWVQEINKFIFNRDEL